MFKQEKYLFEKKFFISLGCFVIFLFFIFFVFLKKEKIADIPSAYQTTSPCSFNQEKKIIRGDSMEPLLRNGASINVLINYYNCHSIQRNDLVLLDYVGNKEANLIKIVKAIPGDFFELKKNNNLYNLYINNQIQKNSNGEIYSFNYEKAKEIIAYQNVYKKIPERRYLVLGDNINGSVDSTKFGLIGEEFFVAKVILN